MLRVVIGTRMIGLNSRGYALGGCIELMGHGLRRRPKGEPHND
jgi:hypothetical protein